MERAQLGEKKKFKIRKEENGVSHVIFMEKCFYINYILVSVENFYNNKNEERRDNEEENGKKIYMYNSRYFNKLIQN